jgi:serine/threonine-protein kinase HipA
MIPIHRIGFAWPNHGVLILVKPRDRYDQCDIPPLEHACMTFAAGKGLNVARTALYAEQPSTLLVERFDRLLT